MCNRTWVAGIWIAGWMLATTTLPAQVRPYIGYAYPAGGKQGTTFEVKLGGQGLEDVCEVIVTGRGVTAKVTSYQRALNPQEMTLLNEQLKALRNVKAVTGSTMMAAADTMMMDTMAGASNEAKARGTNDLAARIQKRISEYVNRPASAALANIVYLEVCVSDDAPPGQRELRLGTPRGISNPLVFEVGQLPEVSRKPMITAPFQVLGKEQLALRQRPAEEAEQRVQLPCTLNGQVASGEVNSYRFTARKGERFVITTRARQLIPYIADAVPGWFQPVLTLSDAKGLELAYDDDYRFKPDPTILFQVPQDGEYVLSIYDAIYRGREDFVYRISIGDLPFVTSIFPLGGRTNAPIASQIRGWNLDQARLTRPELDSEPGICTVVAQRDQDFSNPVPFARDTLPEISEKEPNNMPAQAQKVRLGLTLNGKINRPGDTDVFCFQGGSNESVVAEVSARRLDSPVDSFLKITDASGKVIAFNDDCEDLAAGVNTHHADSYFMTRLPATGLYYVHLTDAARAGGEDYGYRLRLSAPRPDFALRVTPSSAALRGKSSATVMLHAIRRDGFTGPIKVTLKDPPRGFSANPVWIASTQQTARISFKTDLMTNQSFELTFTGTAKILGREIEHEAVPAEDRMQAFLWRHLVPASDFQVRVFDPNAPPVVRRAHRAPQAEPEPKIVPVADRSGNKPKFTKQQVAGRLRQLNLLFQEGLITDDFYEEKVAECEAGSQ